MKFLYNPDLRMHTIHVHDVVRGLFTAAQWMSGLEGRTEANRLAGVAVPNAWYRTVAEKQAMDAPSGDVGLLDKDVKVVVPYFNLVCPSLNAQTRLTGL